MSNLTPEEQAVIDAALNLCSGSYIKVEKPTPEAFNKVGVFTSAVNAYKQKQK